jgi:hypothetical protein
MIETIGPTGRRAGSVAISVEARYFPDHVATGAPHLTEFAPVQQSGHVLTRHRINPITKYRKRGLTFPEQILIATA